MLAPPPKSPMTTAYTDTSPRFNPFDKSQGFAQEAVLPTDSAAMPEFTRTDSQVRFFPSFYSSSVFFVVSLSVDMST